MTTGNYMTVSKDQTSTLLSRDYKDPQCVTYQQVTGSLMANSHPGSYTGQDANNDMLVAGVQNQHYIVRRLTPLECERLQGFPDYWTLIGAWTDTAGKEHKESTDSARYKALGNSIALPPWFYVLRKLSLSAVAQTTRWLVCLTASEDSPLYGKACTVQGAAYGLVKLRSFLLPLLKSILMKEVLKVINDLWIGREKIYIPTCDCCGAELPEEYDFYDAVDAKRANGWQSKKIGTEWVDYCPRCIENMTPTAAQDFGGVVNG